jgi:iron complex outermembrane receptor protein
MSSDLHVRSYSIAFLLLIAGLWSVAAGTTVMAQQGTALRGRLFNALSQEPVADAVVTIEELKRDTRSTSDGSYTFDNVPPGSYHVQVRAQGYTVQRSEVTVTNAPVTLDIDVNPELHFTEVLSVSPQARSQFESYQPTTVLAGQELAKELQGTLGAVLEAQPGIAERSFGPGPSRPVIRGLDGDRVLILEDGQRSGDLSSQSGDHGVNVNPAAASRIEVVRGPATLLYGSSAIGGLVNVISDVIPERRITGTSGGFTLEAGSAAKEAGVAADVLWGNNRWAAHMGASGRRNGDVDTPEGTVENTQSRAGFGNVGVAWTGEKTYAGASYGYDDNKYGIPFVEEGQVQLTPRRHSVSFRAGGQGLAGAIDSYRLTVGHKRYRHDELVGAEIGTQFKNDTTEFELLAGHRQAGRLKGTAGAWALTRAFEAIGDEALSPPVDQRGVAGFLYEEVTWPHVTFQFGGRVDHARYEPEGGLPNRDFTNFSGSVGLLIRPPMARESITLAFSLARAARHPALEELYFNGPHPGNFAIEVGNPDLESERAIGFDMSLRWRHPRASGEITYFRNDISYYIFLNPVEVAGPAEEFPVVEFVAADSVLQGIELHGDFAITSVVFADLGLDYVRGDVTAFDQPLPRIPPLRFRGGLRYQANAFQVGGELVSVARQDRVFGEETPTDGYNLAKLFAAYSFGSGDVLNTITARLDNATDELYRNHLSLIKDFVPEMGINFKVIYSVKF